MPHENRLDFSELYTNPNLLKDKSQKELYFAYEKASPSPQIPLELFDMINLETLEISWHPSLEIPEEFGNLTKLKSLEFHYSHIIKALPQSIGQLRQLEDIQLIDCKLTTLPEEFGKLSELSNLNLQENNLKQMPSCIGSLRNLKALYLFENELKYFPFYRNQLPKLIYLDIRGNKFSQSEIERICKEFPDTNIDSEWQEPD